MPAAETRGDQERERVDSSRWRRGRSRCTCRAAIAQMKATTPLSMLGAWKCTAGFLYERTKKNRPPRGPVQEIRRVCRGFVHNPGRLSDLSPCGLPRTASRCCFNLLPRRARRTCESRGWATHMQAVENQKARILRIFNNQHFHSRPCSLWISSVSQVSDTFGSQVSDTVRKASRLRHGADRGGGERPAGSAGIADSPA